MSESTPLLGPSATPSSSSNTNVSASRRVPEVIRSKIFERTFKIVFLGESGVGKTALTWRFAHSEFQANSFLFVGMDCRSRVVRKGKKCFYVELWDTAGVSVNSQSEIILDFFHLAKAVALVFDIENRTSFEKLRDWLDLARRHCGDKLPMYVFGNKFDLDSSRAVSRKEIRAFAKLANVGSFEVSALTGHGIQESLMDMVETLEQIEVDKMKRPNERQRTTFLSEIRSLFACFVQFFCRILHRNRSDQSHSAYFSTREPHEHVCRSSDSSD